MSESIGNKEKRLEDASLLDVALAAKSLCMRVPSLSAKADHVLKTLIMYCAPTKIGEKHHQDFGCFPSQATLAASTSLSRKSIMRAVEELRELGLIATSPPNDSRKKTVLNYSIKVQNVLAGANRTWMHITPRCPSEGHTGDKSELSDVPHSPTSGPTQSHRRGIEEVLKRSIEEAALNGAAKEPEVNEDSLDKFSKERLEGMKEQTKLLLDSDFKANKIRDYERAIALKSSNTHQTHKEDMK